MNKANNHNDNNNNNINSESECHLEKNPRTGLMLLNGPSFTKKQIAAEMPL